MPLSLPSNFRIIFYKASTYQTNLFTTKMGLGKTFSNSNQFSNKNFQQRVFRVPHLFFLTPNKSITKNFLISALPVFQFPKQSPSLSYTTFLLIPLSVESCAIAGGVLSLHDTNYMPFQLKCIGPPPRQPSFIFIRKTPRTLEQLKHTFCGPSTKRLRSSWID